jgi:hypothetical protein
MLPVAETVLGLVPLPLLPPGQVVRIDLPSASYGPPDSNWVLPLLISNRNYANCCLLAKGL